MKQSTKIILVLISEVGVLYKYMCVDLKIILLFVTIIDTKYIYYGLSLNEYLP